MTEITERLTGDLPLASAEQAASHVASDATVAMSSLGGGPKEVPPHVVPDGEEGRLTVLGTADAGLVADTTLIDDVERRYPFAVWGPVKQAVNEGRMRFVDAHLSQVREQIQQHYFGNVDTAIVEAVAVGEDWFVPSTVVGATPTYVREADELILEVNRGEPLAFQRLHDVYVPDHRERIPLDAPGDRIGDPRIRFDPTKLVAVVETDVEPPSYPFRELTAAEEGIVGRFGDFVQRELDRNPLLEEMVSFEIGVGSLGDAVTRGLADVDFGGTTPHYYAEVLQDAVLDLLDDDVFRDASAMSMVLSEDGKQRILDDVERYAEDVALRPLAVSNDPDLIRRFDVVTVNAAVEVDLYGNVNSSHVRGSRLLQGVGGSADFSRHGLVSVFVLPSTLDGDDVSRIVPMASHVDHTEHDVDVVITEQGVADLRGLDPRERAEALIEGCAHPDHRDALRRYVERADDEGGHIPHDLDRSFDWRRG